MWAGHRSRGRRTLELTAAMGGIMWERPTREPALQFIRGFLFSLGRRIEACPSTVDVSSDSLRMNYCTRTMTSADNLAVAKMLTRLSIELLPLPNAGNCQHLKYPRVYYRKPQAPSPTLIFDHSCWEISFCLLQLSSVSIKYSSFLREWVGKVQ